MKKLILGSVTLLTASVAAQGWSVLPLGTTPPARNNHATAYDFVNQHYVIFGSQNGANDTWIFDGVGWSAVAGVAPAARYSSHMAMDLLGPGLMLFGGAPNTVAGSPLSETWRLVNGSWQQLSPATSPGGRIAHSMVSLISSAGVLMFGGRNPSNQQLNDTWWWNGVTWTMLASGGPPARCCHDMAYDSDRDRVVLFGGWNGGNLGDTWEWDGAAWTQMLPSSSPSARWGHRMAYDPVLQRVVLHGGDVDGTETWFWDGVDWTLVDPNGPDVINHGLDYDATNGRILSFGGYPLNSDLRVFTVQTPASLTEFGAGCAGPGGLPQLAAAGTGLPWLGATPVLKASNVPLLGLFVLGYSNTSAPVGPLPASLAAIGMPGCDLLVSNDVIVGGTQVGAQSQLPLPVPNVPSLVSQSVHAQALSLDLGANALGFTASNGLQLTIGQL